MSDTVPRTAATDAQERAMVDDARALHRDKHVARTAAELMIPGGLLALLAAQIDAARGVAATGVRVATDAAEEGRGHGSGHDARSPARGGPARRDG